MPRGVVLAEHEVAASVSARLLDRGPGASKYRSHVQRHVKETDRGCLHERLAVEVELLIVQGCRMKTRTAAVSLSPRETD